MKRFPVAATTSTATGESVDVIVGETARGVAATGGIVIDGALTLGGVEDWIVVGATSAAVPGVPPHPCIATASIPAHGHSHGARLPLLIPQGFNGLQARRSIGRVDAKEQADRCRE